MVWLLLFSYHLGLFLWPISAELVRTSLITPLNRFFQFLLTEGGIILWTFTGSMTATRRWQDLFLGETPVWTESRERKVIHKTQEPERTWPLKIQPKPKHFYQTCINRECSSVYLFEAHFFLNQRNHGFYFYWRWLRIWGKLSSDWILCALLTLWKK